MISIITAYDRNRLIGNNNTLPWKLPRDLTYFKEKTTGKIVIQGRKTFESFKQPLPNRTNIIITSDPDYQAEGCYVYNSIGSILHDYLNYSDCSEEVFVIGGSATYKQFLPYLDRLYITEINQEFVGDAYFPDIDMSEWRLISSTQGIKDDRNPYDYYFKIYERK